MQTVGLIHTLEQCLNRMQTVGHTLEQCLNRMQTVGPINTLEQCFNMMQTVGLIHTLEQCLNRMQTVGLIHALEQCFNMMQTMGLIHTLEQCLNRMQTVGLIHALVQYLNRMQTVGLIHTLEQCFNMMQTVGLIHTLEQCLNRMQTVGLINTLEQCLNRMQTAGLIHTLDIVAMDTGGRVYQYPAVVTAMRGQHATIPCHFFRGSANYGVHWYKSQGTARPRDGERLRRTEISLPTLPPRFSYAEDKASLSIVPVTVEDAGVYYCAVRTLGRGADEGNGTELLVLAPPSAPQLFLQVSSNLWSGLWNVFCVTEGFHPNQVWLTWSQNGGEKKHPDCTPESADPGTGQLNGLARRNLSLEGNPDCAPNGWLTDTKPHPHHRCVHVMDSCGQGRYLISVLPLPFGPVAGETYTCTVHGHPALSTPLSTALYWGKAAHSFKPLQLWSVRF
ncbi:hypothetical protein AAFF_G00329180 [Aldrovandia affinis]|uniref:Ig-like domain-containing protein n=1 Tax=Aldrovandia affinis TaxID=143900 RepID=A0AAD7WPZ3_9TELE|nr:hypothetical protein AAFF_G00329180 [Aldrovandia affinis]